ncbi:unnamed protein product [Onchocerca flexuosa]|uniref:DB domain-containing protein n=1 Tax=Onchocerca flexuosa TaxID=387005 RepID=A0A183HGC2_9BILA|nr:unnamed protein product [Onchocerca flexuosa]
MIAEKIKHHNRSAIHFDLPLTMEQIHFRFIFCIETYSVVSAMNSSLVIFVTAIFVILARGDDWQQLLEKREILTEMMRNEYFLGDEELMVPSRADERFRECCIAEIGDFYCTNQLCSISSISRMTPSALISHVLQCSRKMRKIWSCASQMRDQSDCCIER